MEHMRGTPPDAEFEGMSLDDQNKFSREVAGVIRAMQQYEPPESIQGFGGLDFDRDGTIVTALLTLFSCGPFTTYSKLVKGVLREQLDATDMSPVLHDWVANDTRAKLERFIAEDVDRMLQSINTKKILVHRDLSTFSCYIPISTPFSCRPDRIIRAR
jgi:hypothetical protein